MYFARCPRQLHAWHGEITTHTGRMREFADFMTGQGLRNAQRLSTVRSWRRLRIRCGLEYSGEPSTFTPCKALRVLTRNRTMTLGPFVGPIYTIILIVDCLFFAFLEWWMPRENIDYVDVSWDASRFEKVSPCCACYSGGILTFVRRRSLDRGAPEMMRSFRPQ
jgi:hypothetical protein